QRKEQYGTDDERRAVGTGGGEVAATGGTCAFTRTGVTFAVTRTRRRIGVTTGCSGHREISGHLRAIRKDDRERVRAGHGVCRNGHGRSERTISIRRCRADLYRRRAQLEDELSIRCETRTRDRNVTIGDNRLCTERDRCRNL